jgi:hypothetical protein
MAASLNSLAMVTLPLATKQLVTTGRSTNNSLFQGLHYHKCTPEKGSFLGLGQTSVTNAHAMTQQVHPQQQQRVDKLALCCHSTNLSCWHSITPFLMTHDNATRTHKPCRQAALAIASSVPIHVCLFNKESKRSKCKGALQSLRQRGLPWHTGPVAAQWMQGRERQQAMAH